MHAIEKEAAAGKPLPPVVVPAAASPQVDCSDSCGRRCCSA